RRAPSRCVVTKRRFRNTHAGRARPRPAPPSRDPPHLTADQPLAARGAHKCGARAGQRPQPLAGVGLLRTRQSVITAPGGARRFQKGKTMQGWLKTAGVAGATVAFGLSLASCSKPATETAAQAPAAASADKEYTIGWTIYAGWMPWPYAQQAGIVQKWLDK